MKIYIAILITISSYVGASGQSSLSTVEWLVGSWNRTNSKPGRSGIEIWIKKSDQEFIGRGINLRGADTTFIEKLKIVVRENKVYYVADVPENKEPVYFEATSISGQSITFENQKHDFPKKISYTLSGNSLKATISGDGKSIDYWFERK